MKKKIAILLLTMILIMSFTAVVAYATVDTDLNSWKSTGTANAELKGATKQITGLGLAVDYIVANAFKMILSIVVGFISIKLLFAKSGQSSDTAKQKILYVITSVLIYILGVPILNMLGKSFATLF